MVWFKGWLISGFHSPVNHIFKDIGANVLLEKTNMLHLIYQLQWLLQQKIRRILITSCYLIVAPAVFSQAGAVYPSQPSWGDTLLISYRLPDPSAILQGGEPVYAKITTWMQDGG